MLIFVFIATHHDKKKHIYTFLTPHLHFLNNEPTVQPEHHWWYQTKMHYKYLQNVTDAMFSENFHTFQI